MFIDIHSHIIPGADDGSESVAESIAMLKKAYASGTKIIVATPHIFNRHKQRIRTDKDVLIEKFRELKKSVVDAGIDISVYLGSEVFCSGDRDLKASVSQIIPINGSRYVLAEFDFNENIYNIRKKTHELSDLGFIPVIAHPERYEIFLYKPDSIKEVINDGALIQINKDSILGFNGNGIKELCLKMLKNNYVHFIAGDSHNENVRNADMQDVYQYLISILNPKEIALLMHDNPKKILLNKDIQSGV